MVDLMCGKESVVGYGWRDPFKSTQVLQDERRTHMADIRLQVLKKLPSSEMYNGRWDSIYCAQVRLGLEWLDLIFFK